MSSVSSRDQYANDQSSVVEPTLIAGLSNGSICRIDRSLVAIADDIAVGVPCEHRTAWVR